MPADHAQSPDDPRPRQPARSHQSPRTPLPGRCRPGPLHHYPAAAGLSAHDRNGGLLDEYSRGGAYRVDGARYRIRRYEKQLLIELLRSDRAVPKPHPTRRQTSARPVRYYRLRRVDAT